MEIDESIALLGAKLDKWFDENRATFASEDRKEQGDALLAGFDLVRELDRLKGDGLAAISMLLKRTHTSAPTEYAASLLRGFEFAAKLADTLHDELLDTDGETKVVILMNEIVKSLDGIGSGRTALAVLLENSDPRIRAAAGAFLIKVMPERVIPILREIEDQQRGHSSGSNAHWTLLRWERDSKAQGR